MTRLGKLLCNEILILEKALRIANRNTPGEEKEAPKSSDAANE